MMNRVDVPKVMSLVLVLLMLSALPVGLMQTAAQTRSGDGPWSVPVRVDNGPKADKGTSFVQLALDEEGDPHVAWLENREDGTDCFVSSSDDAGDSWSGDLRLDPRTNQPRNTPTTCDIGSDDDGRIYVCYSQWIVDQGWWRVRFARSDDGGETFRDPSDAYQQVSDSLAQEHPAMAVSPSGTLHIVYIERTPTSQRILYVRSADGLNPQPPQAIDVDMPETENHVQADIALGPDGAIYVAYGFRSMDGAGIKLAVRASPTAGFEVRQAALYSEDIPRALRPRIAVSADDVVEIVYDPLDEDGRIMHIRSTDGGDTFNPPSRVSVQGATYEAQTNPDVAFDTLGFVHVVFTQEYQGRTRVYHTLSYDGKSFTAPTLMTGSWDADEMGPMGREDMPSIQVLPDGSVLTAFSATLNRTAGVWFAKLLNNPPVVTMTTPHDGSTVKGLVIVQGTAADPEGNTGLAAVYLKIGENDPIRFPGTTYWEHSFNSNNYDDGPLTMTAYASDGFTLGPEVVITVSVENNVAPRLNLAKPENATEHAGVVNVVGSAQDIEGFGDGSAVQWRLGDDGDWVDDRSWELQNDNVLDFDFNLHLSQRPTGPASISVRVSDGVKFCIPQTRDFRLVNKPDLTVDRESVAYDILEPMHEDLLTITVTVKNVGVTYSGAYVLEFWRFNVKEGSEAGTNLSAGDQEDLIFVWEAFAGIQDLRFVVDPSDLVNELDEANNEVKVELTVGKASEDDEGSGIPWLPIVLGVVGIVVVAGGAIYYMKWKTDTMPTGGGERVVYEEGGLYSEQSGPYGQGGEGGEYAVDQSAPPGSGAEPFDTPTLDAQDNSQLIQDVSIDPEKVERS